MKKAIALTAGALMLASFVTACGDEEKGGPTGDYCTKIRAYEAKAEELDAVFGGEDTEAAAAAFREMQSMVADLAASAPSEIADDVKLMSSGINQMVAVLEKYDYDFMALATAPEAEEFMNAMNSEEMAAAGERLEQYSEEVCGIQTDG